MLVFLGSPALHTCTNRGKEKKEEKKEEMLGDLHVGQVKPNQEEINKLKIKDKKLRVRYKKDREKTHKKPNQYTVITTKQYNK